MISDSLVQAFTEQFDCAPDRIVRAPGRVNLIGEHVDYAGLPVFPMALQYAVYVAVRPRDDRLVSVASSDPGYEPREFELDPEIEPFPDGDWGNYVKAAAGVARDRFGCTRGVTARVDSTLPPAAGLSSCAMTAGALARTSASVSNIVMSRALFMRSSSYGWVRTWARAVVPVTVLPWPCSFRLGHPTHSQP